MASRMLSSRAFVVRSVRKFSTPAPGGISPEEVKQFEEFRLRHVKHNQKSAYPFNVPNLHSNGKDLDEPEDITEISALTGMPEEHQKRTVVIGPRPTRSSQTGMKLVHQWQLTWKPRAMWKNPLMGWASSGDPMASVKLYFDSAEHAIKFASRNGWKYEVLQPASTENVDKEHFQYKDNFLDPAVFQKMQKEGRKSKEFAMPGYGKSNWFMPLKYHGDGPVSQHGPSVATA